MAEEVKLERVYNVPLRKEFMKAPRYKRTMKAVKALREFLKKHMKCEIVKIGKYANLKLHERGRKNPPHHIKVKVIKVLEKVKGKDVEIVRAELVGAPEEKKIKEKVKETKKEKKKEEIKGETILPEEKSEEKLEEKEKEEGIKKKVLEKTIEKGKEVESKVKLEDKEKSIKSEQEAIIRKDEKPIHEKKKKGKKWMKEVLF